MFAQSPSCIIHTSSHLRSVLFKNQDQSPSLTHTKYESKSNIYRYSSIFLKATLRQISTFTFCVLHIVYTPALDKQAVIQQGQCPSYIERGKWTSGMCWGGRERESTDNSWNPTTKQGKQKKPIVSLRVKGGEMGIPFRWSGGLPVVYSTLDFPYCTYCVIYGQEPNFSQREVTGMLAWLPS